jgi:hypothetical protein
VNGAEEACFVVDTGASISVLRPEYAQRLGITALPGTEYSLNSPAGWVETGLAQVHLRLGDAEVDDVAVALLDLPLPGVVGILSPQSALGDCLVALSFRDWTLRASLSGPEPLSLPELPLVLGDGRPQLRVAGPTPFQRFFTLDTGAEQSWMIESLSDTKRDGCLARDWPWLRADATCVLLIAPALQWVASCATPPDSFKEVGAPLLGKPVYVHAGDTISMGGQTIPATAFIAAMPATADVPLPNDSTTALAANTPWIIASSLDGLIGSNPGFGKETSTEEWLSVFLHEFFHTRQMLVPSFRATLTEMKSGKVDAAALEKLFKDDANYRSLLEREYSTLSAAAARDAALTPELARAALQEWSALYRERRALLEKLGGAPLAHADVVLTYVEGTARYVEAQFLSSERFHSALPLTADPHFQGYRPFSAKPGYEGLVQRKMGPRYYYSLGMHLALLLDRANPTWKTQVSEEPEWIIGLASASGGSPLPKP